MSVPNEGSPEWWKYMASAVLVGAIVASHYMDTSRDEKLAAQSTAQIGHLQEQLADREQLEDRLLNGAALLSGLTPEQIAEAKYVRPEYLPGARREVSPEDAEALAESLVKIYKRDRSSPDPNAWEESCSGNLITYGGTEYVVSAKHCFIPGSGGKGGPPAVPTFDITATYKYEYMAGLPGQDPNVAPEGAPIEGISVTDSGDWSLLRIGWSENDLSSREPIDIEKRSIKFPQPGESVVVYSMPAAAEGDIVRGEGVYLGTIPDPTSDMGVVDFVGISNAETPKVDACNFGASGSLAVMASGYVTGPASYRNNLHYEPGSPDNTGDLPQSALRIKLLQEYALGIDTSSFNTVCAYTTNNFMTGQRDKIQALIEGYGRTASGNPVQLK